MESRNIDRYMKSLISLNTTTAYLTGVIIGDGNLSNYTKSKTDLSKDYRIIIDISDIEYLHHLETLFKSIIYTKTCAKVSKVKPNHLPRQYLQIRNKELFLFFSEVMKIPKGKKSDIVIVPPSILDSNAEIKKYFLAGYFDTDGGFRNNTLGFTTASKNLNKGISEILSELNFQHSIEKWINHRYNKTFYGIKISKKEIDRFLNTLQLQNYEKLKRIRNKFFMRRCRSGQTG
ncbi:MAG: LAGLIDADG family homing endonuclease [Candidatus Woesearchaeota archaeon]